MPVTEYACGGGANDGHVYGDGVGAWTYSNLRAQFGWYNATVAYFPWCRIPNVTRAKGASLPADAFLVFQGHYTDGGTPGQHYQDWHGILEPNHVAPVDAASWAVDHGLHTVAAVADDLAFRADAPLQDCGYFSRNLATIIKELTDQVLWVPGNAMGFHADTDLGSPLGAQGMRGFDCGRLVVIDAGEGWPRPAGCIGHALDGDWDTSKVIAYPKDMVAGETLLCALANGEGRTLTWPADWHVIRQITDGGPAVGLAVAWHKVTGAEAATFSLTASGNAYVTGVIFRVAGAADPDVTPPEASAGATGNSVNPDPDAISPTGGAQNYLVLAFAAMDSHAEATAYPYTLWQGTDTGVTSTAHAAALSLINAATINPGTFTIDDLQEWAACTVVVYPAPVGAADEAAWHMLVGA